MKQMTQQERGELIQASINWREAPDGVTAYTAKKIGGKLYAHWAKPSGNFAPLKYAGIAPEFACQELLQDGEDNGADCWSVHIYRP